MKSKRVYATLAVFLAFIAAFAFLPLPISRVLETGLVAGHPEHSSPVGLSEPAALFAIYTPEGHAVRKGQRIAEFKSVALQEERSQAVAKLEELRRVAADLSADVSVVPPAEKERIKFEADRAKTEADGLARELERIDQRIDTVSNVLAPADGVVMGVPLKSDIGKLFDRNTTQGRPVCTVGDPTKLIVRVPVGALDYRLLKEDLPVRGELDVSVYVTGRTDHVFRGKVKRLPESDAKQVPHALTQRGGGPLAVKQSGPDGQEVSPVAQVYLITVELDDPDATIRPGALVQAKIHCQWRSGGWWLKREFAEALDIGLY